MPVTGCAIWRGPPPGRWPAPPCSIGLLSGWVGDRRRGRHHRRVQIQITQAAVPMRGFTRARAPVRAGPGTFLTIWNPGRKADELLSVSSPIAHRIVLVRRGGPEGPGAVVPDLTIPAGGTLTLTPFGTDVVLRGPGAVRDDTTVRLTLTFRRARQISVTADFSSRNALTPDALTPDALTPDALTPGSSPEQPTASAAAPGSCGATAVARRR